MKKSKLNYLRILQKQFKSGRISKKEYKKERKWTRQFKD